MFALGGSDSRYGREDVVPTVFSIGKGFTKKALFMGFITDG